MKVHCIAYPIKSLFFCKLFLFFQHKARITDSSDNEFIDSDKPGLNQNPTKKVMLLYDKLF